MPETSAGDMSLSHFFATATACERLRVQMLAFAHARFEDYAPARATFASPIARDSPEDASFLFLPCRPGGYRAATPAMRYRYGARRGKRGQRDACAR